MIQKYKIPCDHCKETTEVEYEECTHKISEQLEDLEKKIATLWKVIGEGNENDKKLVKELEVINKLFEGYDEFLADCDHCDFRKKGSLGQVLKITYCPSCKEKLSLKALILPPDIEESLQEHMPTALKEENRI